MDTLTNRNFKIFNDLFTDLKTKSVFKKLLEERMDFIPTYYFKKPKNVNKHDIEDNIGSKMINMYYHVLINFKQLIIIKKYIKAILKSSITEFSKIPVSQKDYRLKKENILFENVDKLPSQKDFFKFVCDFHDNKCSIYKNYKNDNVYFMYIFQKLYKGPSSAFYMKLFRRYIDIRNVLTTILKNHNGILGFMLFFDLTKNIEFLRAKEYLNDANTGEKKNNGNYNYRNYMLSVSENETNLEDYNVHDVLRMKDTSAPSTTMAGGAFQFNVNLNEINNTEVSNYDLKKQIRIFNQCYIMLVKTPTIFNRFYFKNSTGVNINFSNYISTITDFEEEYEKLKEIYNEIKNNITLFKLQEANESIIKCIHLIYIECLTKIIDKYYNLLRGGAYPPPLSPDEQARLEALKEIKDAIVSKKPIELLQGDDIINYLESFEKLLTQIGDDNLTKNFKNITNITTSPLLEESIKILEELLKKEMDELTTNTMALNSKLDNLYKKFFKKDKILYSEFKDIPLYDVTSKNYKFIKTLYLKYYIEKIIQLKDYVTIIPHTNINDIIEEIYNIKDNFNRVDILHINSQIGYCINMIRNYIKIELDEKIKTHKINKYLKNKLEDLVKVINMDIYEFDDTDYLKEILKIIQTIPLSKISDISQICNHFTESKINFYIDTLIKSISKPIHFNMAKRINITPLFKELIEMLENMKNFSVMIDDSIKNIFERLKIYNFKDLNKKEIVEVEVEITGFITELKEIIKKSINKAIQYKMDRNGPDAGIDFINEFGFDIIPMSTIKEFFSFLVYGTVGMGTNEFISSYLRNFIEPYKVEFGANPAFKDIFDEFEKLCGIVNKIDKHKLLIFMKKATRFFKEMKRKKNSAVLHNVQNEINEILDELREVINSRNIRPLNKKEDGKETKISVNDSLYVIVKKDMTNNSIKPYGIQRKYPDLFEVNLPYLMQNFKSITEIEKGDYLYNIEGNPNEYNDERVFLVDKIERNPSNLKVMYTIISILTKGKRVLTKETLKNYYKIPTKKGDEVVRISATNEKFMILEDHEINKGKFVLQRKHPILFLTKNELGEKYNREEEVSELHKNGAFKKKIPQFNLLYNSVLTRNDYKTNHFTVTNHFNAKMKRGREKLITPKKNYNLYECIIDMLDYDFNTIEFILYYSEPILFNTAVDIHFLIKEDILSKINSLELSLDDYLRWYHDMFNKVLENKTGTLNSTLIKESDFRTYFNKMMGKTLSMKI